MSLHGNKALSYYPVFPKRKVAEASSSWATAADDGQHSSQHCTALLSETDCAGVPLPGVEDAFYGAVSCETPQVFYELRSSHFLREEAPLLVVNPTNPSVRYSKDAIDMALLTMLVSACEDKLPQFRVVASLELSLCKGRN